MPVNKIPMLFSGGLIPGYILIQNLKMMDSIWALILPIAVSVYNVVLMLNFFRGIPRELEEAAQIDGAGHHSRTPSCPPHTDRNRW